MTQNGVLFLVQAAEFFWIESFRNKIKVDQKIGVIVCFHSKEQTHAVESRI